MRRDQEIDRAIAAYKAAVTQADRPITPLSSARPLLSSATIQKLAEGVSDGDQVPRRSSVSSIKSRHPRPLVSKRAGIDEYRPAELLSLIAWIEADGRLRSDRELTDQMVD